MLTWLIGVAAMAGFIAGNLEQRTAVTATCGAVAIYCLMRVLAGRYVKQLFAGPTIRPPAMPADAQAETMAEIADEPSRTRKIGRRQSNNERDQGAA